MTVFASNVTQAVASGDCKLTVRTAGAVAALGVTGVGGARAGSILPRGANITLLAVAIRVLKVTPRTTGQTQPHTPCNEGGTAAGTLVANSSPKAGAVRTAITAGNTGSGAAVGEEALGTGCCARLADIQEEPASAGCTGCR